MLDAVRKVEALIEALSYIRTFRDRLTVIKLGGSAMEEPAALEATLQDIICMETAGMRPIVVHGGGKAIDRAMASSGLQPRKIQGRRYTDCDTLRDRRRHPAAATPTPVSSPRFAQARRPSHVGLHSGSLQCLFGERLTLPGADGQAIDLGHVGQVTRVDIGPLIQDFCAGRVVPVIPSLAFGTPSAAETRWLNVNADTAAAAVAAQLRAEKLVLLTDTPGILRDRQRSRFAAAPILDARRLPRLDCVAASSTRA